MRKKTSSRLSSKLSSKLSAAKPSPPPTISCPFTRLPLTSHVFIDILSGLMREFQKEIKSQKKHSVTNCQYLYDCLQSSQIPCRVQAMIVTGLANKTNKFTLEVQMVIKVQEIHWENVVNGVSVERIVDPSYDKNERVELRYFGSLHEVCSTFPEIREQLMERQWVEDFLKLVRASREMNQNIGHVHEIDYYNAQADYIEAALRPLCDILVPGSTDFQALSSMKW